MVRTITDCSKCLGQTVPDCPECKGFGRYWTGELEAERLARDGFARFDIGTPGSAGDGAPLTEREVLDIRERADAGETLLSISLDYGYSLGGISRIVRGESYAHMGGPLQPRNRKSRYDLDHIQELHAQGLSDPQIGREMGMSKSIIRRLRICYQEKIAELERLQCLKDTVKRLYSEGRSMVSIAKELEIGRNTARRYRDD